MAPSFKRTRIWVDSPFQFRLLLRLMTYFVLYMFAVFHIAFLWEVLQAVSASGPSHLSAQLYGDFLRKQLPMLIGFGALAPVFLYDLVKFSHRVAGPLFRCRKLMQEMAGGKPVPEFKPRENDLMKELFQAFNALIRIWNDRLSAAPLTPATLPAGDNGTGEGGGQAPPAEGTAQVITPSSEMHAEAQAQV